MLDPERVERMNVYYKRTVLVCVAETAILPMLLFVTYIMLAGENEPREVAAPGITFVLGAMALVVMGLAVGLRDWLRGLIVRSPLAARRTLARGAVDTLPEVDLVERVASALWTWNLIVFMLGEVPILLGFVHTIMGGSLPAFTGFIMVGITIWYLNFPRKPQWIAFVEAEDAKAAGYRDIVR